MNSWRVITVAGVLTAALHLPAAAQEPGDPWRTAADLAGFCQQADKTFCYGFLAGAWQFYEQLVAIDEVNIDPFVCPAGEVTVDEAVVVFADWAGAHQDELAQPAIDGLFRAWTAAYPCDGG